MKNFSTRLKELRKKMKLSQQQLANKTGISIKNIGAYEEGRADPPVKNLLLFKKAFNCSSIDELISQESN